MAASTIIVAADAGGRPVEPLDRYFSPPASRLAPSTSSRLPMMLPVSDALTTVVVAP